MLALCSVGQAGLNLLAQGQPAPWGVLAATCLADWYTARRRRRAGALPTALGD
ncbi:MAG TPA: hypothetical protein VFS43_37020 [Polyangiaceae bacterium]|nr:hypothetical protein [Polyangiaceae bacterium]